MLDSGSTCTVVCLQVTSDGTVYVGHQDMTVKKYLPMETSNGCNGVADSLPVSPRLAGNTTAQQVCHAGWLMLPVQFGVAFWTCSHEADCASRHGVQRNLQDWLVTSPGFTGTWMCDAVVCMVACCVLLVWSCRVRCDLQMHRPTPRLAMWALSTTWWHAGHTSAVQVQCILLYLLLLTA
jgi:hypothetical protein